MESDKIKTSVKLEVPEAWLVKAVQYYLDNEVFEEDYKVTNVKEIKFVPALLTFQIRMED